MTIETEAVRARSVLGIALLAIAATTCGIPPPIARAETTVGITAGAALAGDQDLVINLFGPSDTGRRAIQRNVPAPTGILAGLGATHWPDSWRWFGVGLEGLFIDTPMTTRRGRDIAQTRSVGLVDVLARYHVTDRGVFVYGGPTGGFAYTTVHRGSDKVGPAVGVMTGLAVPLTSNLRLRFEVQYLATHDVDSTRTRSERVDVSGSARGNPANTIFGPHLDTQFLPLRFGLDWIFR